MLSILNLLQWCEKWKYTCHWGILPLASRNLTPYFLLPSTYSCGIILSWCLLRWCYPTDIVVQRMLYCFLWCCYPPPSVVQFILDVHSCGNIYLLLWSYPSSDVCCGGPGSVVPSIFCCPLWWHYPLAVCYYSGNYSYYLPASVVPSIVCCLLWWYYLLVWYYSSSVVCCPPAIVIPSAFCCLPRCYYPFVSVKYGLVFGTIAVILVTWGIDALNLQYCLPAVGAHFIHFHGTCSHPC